jgi:hypothetical protein
MAELKFLWAQIDRAVLDLLEATYLSPAVWAAGETFRSNVNRVEATYMLILDMCRHSVSSLAAHVVVAQSLKLTPERIVSELQTPEQKEAMRKELHRLKSKVEVNDKAAMSHFASIEPYLQDEGQESVLASMLIGIWTAIEVLFEDLWERALNEHPHDLCKVTIPQREKKGGIEVSDIQGAGFDLSKQMGTLLKTKFKFHTLDDTRLAYESAFSTDGGDVLKAIRNRDLDAIYHIRNLIAHNNGVIDKHFLEETKTVSTLASIRALGEKARLPIDGPMVKLHVENGIRCGCALLKSVNEWINNHPSPK